MSKMSLPDAYVKRIVDEVIEVVPTERIYIFGSYARGEETAESDLDLYVVASNDGARPIERVAAVRRVLNWITPWSPDGMPKGKDVLCSDLRSFLTRARDLETVEHAVLSEGVQIYAR